MLTAADLDLHARLGIGADLLTQMQVTRVTDLEARELLNLPKWRGRLDGLIYPYPSPITGDVVTRRLRRDHPEIEDGKPKNKYLSAVGDRHHLYFAPGAGAWLADTTVPVVFVEAEKSVLACHAAALRAGRNLGFVGTGGCWCWRGRIGKVIDERGARVDEVGPVPDLALVTWTNRDTIICFDSNAASSDTVRRGRLEFARVLAGFGAVVRIAELPEEPGVNGPDDFVAKYGDGALWIVLDRAPRSKVKPKGSKAAEAKAPPPPPAPPPAACTLEDALAVFRRWLYLEDPAPVLAVAAALVANRAPGDPVWLQLVCAPSSGKTEILAAATRLPFVVSAAKVTESSLLSGTSRKEQAADATGGLLRQIGDFGVLLVKDFTSVLAQNKDARAEALAALREVYDGSWDRPVGTDGGRVLSWKGKCGLIAGVTPYLDRCGSVVSALGDRFLLLRLPDADVDHFGTAALMHGDLEQKMRHELREALAGLVFHADPSRVNRPLSDDEKRRLIRLAAYTCRARTAVDRDGYHQEITYLPQVEGPGRVVKALARLLGGLEAIGCDEATAWAMLTRISVDSVPAIRTAIIRVLLAAVEPARTSDIAAAVETATKTAGRYLEDLSILRLAKRTKRGAADNSPDLWTPTAWLAEYWPEGNAGKSETDKYPPSHQYTYKGSSSEGSSEDHTLQSSVLFSPTFDEDEVRT